MKSYKVIISGGGTGGHIFPAISIANTLKKRFPDIDILFVGAEDRMEMSKVPAAGYPIVGLPVKGFDRAHLFKNIEVVRCLLKSLSRAKKTLRDFRPDIAVGVGGYASGPTLWMASSLGIPTLIQEQNSYAGVTNKLLAKKAGRICVAYEGMEKFFPADRIVLTGNPIRDNIRPYTTEEKAQGQRFFHLDPSLPTVLIVGGSGGCGTFNSVMSSACRANGGAFPYQIVWQSGKGYRTSVSELFGSLEGTTEEDGLRICRNVRNCDFITRMDMAFAAADIVVSRAGAGTISELCAIGKATIFVPSPNVAEDHQTHNAEALVEKNAALMVRDCDAAAELLRQAGELLNDRDRIQMLEQNILSLARPDAARDIAAEVLKLIDN